jgi:hypothetical protein
MTVDADAYPPTRPAIRRNPTSSYTLCAMPISDITTAMPTAARISIGLRP